ncbi:hypothetical protein HMPREF9449_02366 [Odoribacter laneus YIT 12061]|uniref:Thioredoxin domain-containing protein n=2 Tax=Odoribacter laneus TaxID=626933 RepID=H1DIY7_9BACT|nr:hypothetical protein HMPREF9449_02366 [Odoribacter laneus YIT 12061]
MLVVKQILTSQRKQMIKIHPNMKNLLLLVTFISLCTGLKAQSDDRGYLVKTGDMAPDIEIRYTDGTIKKLSDFRGKVVMLQFTASWCGVCRKEMPFIEKDIWQKHKNNPHFALIGIDLKENREKTIKFAQDLKITYPLTLDPEGKSFYSFAEKNAGVTRNIIIDKNGKIVYLTRLYEPEEFQQMVQVIDQLLK